MLEKEGKKIQERCAHVALVVRRWPPLLLPLSLPTSSTSATTHPPGTRRSLCCANSSEQQPCCASTSSEQQPAKILRQIGSWRDSRHGGKPFTSNSLCVYTNTWVIEGFGADWETIDK